MLYLSHIRFSNSPGASFICQCSASNHTWCTWQSLLCTYFLRRRVLGGWFFYSLPSLLCTFNSSISLHLTIKLRMRHNFLYFHIWGRYFGGWPTISAVLLWEIWLSLWFWPVVCKADRTLKTREKIITLPWFVSYEHHWSHLICIRFTATAKQLAAKLEAPIINDLGFSKRYVRCLQVQFFEILHRLTWSLVTTSSRVLLFTRSCFVYIFGSPFV